MRRSLQTETSRRALRRGAGWVGLAVLVTALGIACDDDIAPEPPKSGNQPPETYLNVDADTLGELLYVLPLRWLGTDADGHVTRYRTRWTCDALPGPTPCPAASDWSETGAIADTFMLYIPDGSGTYTFEVAAVDDEGAVDPTPATQQFNLYNTPPIASFEAGSLPTSTLPAITFYVDAVDPDSTADPDDHDSRAGLSQYRAWLDGNEDAARVVPVEADAVTFGPEDFEGRFGDRSVFVQVLDTGGAVSTPVTYTWAVVAAPAQGILLVDDCRMGGFLEDRSDASYRNVLEAGAPGRTIVLDIATVPRLSSADLAAQISLFDRVVWYTDADTLSSGALELARSGLEALMGRAGRWFLCSGIAFGTRGALEDAEGRFRDFFGVDSVFHGPDGSTNFAISLTDTVRAGVSPGLDRFSFLSFGLRAIMDCVDARSDAVTRSLYWYPAGTLVRATADSLAPFVNPVQFDIGVGHELAGGARTVFVSWPAGLPINTNTGENENEIREMLRLVGILEP